MTTYNTVIKKRNDTNNGWDTILPITVAENVLIDEAGNSVKTLQTQINNLDAKKQDGLTIITDVDCNSLTINKEYIVINTNNGLAANNVALNYPPVVGIFHLAVKNSLAVNEINGLIYIATNRETGSIYTRHEINGIFSDWKRILQYDKLEIDIPLASGFVADASVPWKNKIIRNDDGSYDLWFAVKKSDDTNIPTGIIQIGNMVSGHAPNGFYIGNSIAIESDTAFTIGYCYADTGRLMFHNSNANAKMLKGYIRFRAD